MPELQKFQDKLSPECQADMESLILELKAVNQKVHNGKRCIGRTEIVPLPDDKYVRLWEYLRHCCLLVACWPNHRRAIRTISDKRGMPWEDVRDEAVDSMAIHCYLYVWRHYEHSDEPTAYVISTASYGWKDWITEQNNFHIGIDRERERQMTEDRRCGHKVSNVNLGIKAYS